MQDHQGDDDAECQQRSGHTARPERDAPRKRASLLTSLCHYLSHDGRAAKPWATVDASTVRARGTPSTWIGASEQYRNGAATRIPHRGSPEPHPCVWVLHLAVDDSVGQRIDAGKSHSLLIADPITCRESARR